MSGPIIFGVRHLSPSCAWHLRKLLDDRRPRLVLVEGPSDLTDQMENIAHQETEPPIAILAYTREPPIESILYPFAEYSPEYQAILWASEHRVPCRFIDLPSEVFLAMGDTRGPATEPVYEALERQAGEDGLDTFWERTLEHMMDSNACWEGVKVFGERLREQELAVGENQRDDLREAHMRREIALAVTEGYAPEEILVVTGAYHVAGLRTGEPMTDEAYGKLPRVPANQTLMPNSYYRLSTRSGYGAGNKAPAYFGLVWEGLRRGDPLWHARSYLARIARFQRKDGNPVSAAAVIEGVRLSQALAALRGQTGIPVLRDLRDAAVTCLGGGSLSTIARAVADTEIGTVIGALPEGVSQTSIQTDFQRQLKVLKLTKYRTLTAQDLPLDLRENRRVKSQAAAFLDLHRSRFLHQLRVLEVSFAEKQPVRQENATWAEQWVLRWTPESEIQLVEAALRGDTVVQAAAFRLQDQIEHASGMGDVSAALESAIACGLPEVMASATTALQHAAVDAAGLEELAATAERLSIVIQYGGIRQMDSKPLEPILEQIHLRSCLILESACICDDSGVTTVAEAIGQLNAASLAHSFLDSARWTAALRRVAERDDLNTRLSGLAAAILLERSAVDGAWLSLEVQRRLSPGVPADLGAGWFEGLSMKNRYALIARLSLWRSLSEYLDTLDEEEFKRALVYLRRAFADFSALEKDQVAENLGEIWGLDSQMVSETVNAALPQAETAPQEAQELLDGLDGFDFDDL